MTRSAVHPPPAPTSPSLDLGRPVRPDSGEGRIAQAVGDLCREAVAGGASLRLNVVGDCMTPLIRDGEEVEVEPQARLLPGDVVAVLGADDQVRVHRFLGVVPHLGWKPWSRARWITRADAARWIDAPTGRARVLGRVRAASFGNRVRASLQLLGVVSSALGRRARSGSSRVLQGLRS